MRKTALPFSRVNRQHEPIMFAYTSLYYDDPPCEGRALDLWLPKPGAAPRPFALLFIHGGGWHSGTRQQMHGIMKAFYAEGYPCLSVDYRLGKGRTIDVQLADVREGMGIAREQLEAAGLPGRIVLYGSSAGGHLALLAGLATPGACGEKVLERPAPEIVGIIASCAPITFEPWENPFPPIRGSMERAVGSSWEEAPGLYTTYSPETHLSPASPPLFFQLGECEHLFPNELTLAVVERLRASGQPAEAHSYPRAEHGFFYDTTRPCQQLALADTLAFLDRLAGG